MRVATKLLMAASLAASTGWTARASATLLEERSDYSTSADDARQLDAEGTEGPEGTEALPQGGTCGHCPGCAIRTVTAEYRESAASLLRRAGVRAADVNAAVTAMKREAGLRSVFPGMSFTVALGPGGKLESIERRPTAAISQCVERTDEGSLAGRVFELGETVTSMVEVDVSPSRTLEQALGERGEHPVLAFRVKRVLAAWDALTAEGQAERLRVVVEKRVLDGTVLSYGKILAVEESRTEGKARRAYWSEEAGAHPGYYDEHGSELAIATLDWPLADTFVTSGFGFRKTPFRRRGTGVQLHLGLDLEAKRGIPVYAAADGVVMRSGREGGYGNSVVLSHEDGLATRYAHLRRIVKGMKPGTLVARGELLGWSGSTGMATGPHLHFETIVRGTPIDPLQLLGTPAPPLTPEERDTFARAISGLLSRSAP